ncbi:hypothetical protein O9993_13675 [Vibrio lentus]|nr:hypothetical protein [Vibrio lentus]
MVEGGQIDWAGQLVTMQVRCCMNY